MSEVAMNKEYVVLALSTDYSNKYLKKVLKCEYYTIQEYVKGLVFGDSVELHFFDIDELSEEGAMDWKNTGVESVVMDNNKSFKEFTSELSELMDKLEIKKEKKLEEENNKKSEGRS